MILVHSSQNCWSATPSSCVFTVQPLGFLVFFLFSFQRLPFLGPLIAPCRNCVTHVSSHKLVNKQYFYSSFFLVLKGESFCKLLPCVRDLFFCLFNFDLIVTLWCTLPRKLMCEDFCLLASKGGITSRPSGISVIIELLFEERSPTKSI